MKNRLLFLVIFISFTACSQELLYDYVFFANSRMQGNYFFSKTTSSGNSSVSNQKNKLPVSNQTFFTPGNSLVLEYTNGGNGQWQAIIYKDQLRGQDHFKQAAFLSFWVKASFVQGSEEDLPFVQLMQKDSSLSKKISFAVRKINAWESIILPLSSFGKEEIKNPSDIIAVIFSQQGKDGKKKRLYVDDIEFLSSKTPQLPSAKPSISIWFS